MATIEQIASILKQVAKSVNAPYNESDDFITIMFTLPNGRKQEVIAAEIPNETYGTLAMFASFIGPMQEDLSAAQVLSANMEMVWSKLVVYTGKVAVAAFQPPEALVPEEVVTIIREVAFFADYYQELVFGEDLESVEETKGKPVVETTAEPAKTPEPAPEEAPKVKKAFLPE